MMISSVTAALRSLRIGAAAASPVSSVSVLSPSAVAVRPLATVAPLTLSALSDNLGAVKSKRRVGRGNGSGRGKTSGRGHKGQKARRGTGKPRLGFEGGQTPLLKRIPKRGFTNVHAKDLVTVNVDKLQRWIDVGRLNPQQPITIKELYDSRLIHSVKDGVKLLGDGAAYLRTPVHIEVTQASASAIKAIEAVGGKVVSVYYNELGLKALVKPHKFRILPRRAEPTSTREIDYYADEANRGYLALGVLPTYPAPSAKFWGGAKHPTMYDNPPLAPIKPTEKLLAARRALAERGIKDVLPKMAADDELLVVKKEADSASA
ncbi:ribosomal protein L18e/L15P [Catenaria anguillulae PL171]|uniref:Ribosomal protein L18e/L15P n=1 Tax=Catenaria anguillulae PL171 TaxID=765915 RepID=A0A1Y2HIH9_9FUNG|nr:ribosomal protein L18e/L15P [Catenaria anguillulae PL171]